jgi:hypothetical protein
MYCFMDYARRVTGLHLTALAVALFWNRRRKVSLLLMVVNGKRILA